MSITKRFTVSINRDIVECKVANYGMGFAILRVLIETLWNVKSKRPGDRPSRNRY